MIKIIKKDKSKRDELKNQEEIKQGQKQAPEETVSSKFSRNFDENFDKFKEYLHESDDVIFRQFTSIVGNTKCGVIFVDGLVNKDLIQMHIIRPLMEFGEELKKDEQQERKKENAALLLMEKVVTAAEIEEAENLDKAMLPLLSGDTILIIDGYDKAIVIGTRKWENRGVQEPASETVVRGPREGFAESLRFNTALIRRRVRDPNLVQKTLTVGRRSKTSVVLSYIKGIARPDLVETIEKRIKAIDIDDIFEGGEIEQLIEDNGLSPFPQMQNTERPDKVVAGIMEGRVAIIIDGSPFVLIAPANLYQFFQVLRIIMNDGLSVLF